MVKLATSAAIGFLLILVSCGGSGFKPHLSGQPGSSSIPLGQGGPNELASRMSPLSSGSSRMTSVVPAEPIPAPQGIQAPKPANPEAAIRDAAARAASNRHTSATVITVPTTTLSTTSPVGGGTSHGYAPQAGLTWVEAQASVPNSEYHVTGSVNSLTLAPDGVSYATIGLITWFNYDYALNQTVPPVSAYMFSQNLYLHMRVVGTDPVGSARVRLADSNGFFSSTEFIAPVPFNYDLKLTPNNPIISTPPLPPYTSHQCGLATLTVNNVPLPLPMAYGNDNWGWRIAAGPEQYDLASGGATVIGQVYSSGDTVTSAINFDADLVTGPIATTDPSEWWYYGQNRENSRSSDFTAAHTPGLLWAHTLGGATIFDSPPVIGGTGTVYTAAQDNKTRAHDPATGAEIWQVTTPGVGLLAGPTISETGTLYVANSSPPYRLYSVQDNGATGNLQWNFNVGDPVFAPPIVGYDGTIYLATTTTLYALTDAGAAAVVKWTLGFGSISPMAINASGTLYVVDPTGVLRAVTDLGASGVVNWSVGTGNNQVCGPALATDGTIYVATSSPGVASLTDNGATFTINWSGILPAQSTNGMAVSASKVLYMALQDGNLYAIQDNGSSAALNWVFTCGCFYSAPALASDNVVYIGCTNAPFAGRYLALQDNGLSATQLWSFNTGQSIGYGASATLAEDGTVYAATTGPKLFAIHDSGAVGPHIDCTSLPNARFTVFNAGGTPLTGSLDTDVIFDTSSIPLVTGDQFYVQFSLDPVASPNDAVLYPARPDRTVGGLVTVNAANLTIAPSLVPFFDNPVGTMDLVLKPNAYNRVANDVTSQAPSQYSLFDTVSAATFSPTLLCSSSAVQRAVLAANTEYQVQFAPRLYPLASSNPATLGSVETIYPTKFASGRFVVGFNTLTEAGALAGANNDNTDYYTQAALVNSIDADAYTRFESQASATLLAQYGFRDATLGTWIVIPSFPFGREPLAKPFDVFSFARGTVFQASDGTQFSANITVGPGLALNATTYPNGVTAAIGGASVALEPMPTRVFDDPSQPDPGQAGATVSGIGPWTVPLYFGLQYGTAPKTVEVDADYGGTVADTGTGTPAAWNNGIPGRVYTVTGSPFATDGLIAASLTIPLTQPIGTYRFAIRVTDTAGRQYTYVWPNTVTTTGAPPSWHVFVASPTGGTISGISLAVVNNNPAMGWWDGTNMRYIRASAPDGSTWTNPAVQVSTAGTSTYATPCLKVITGNPALAYYQVSPANNLMFARGNDINGTTWGAPVIVAPSGSGADVSMLTLPSGNPAIAFLRNSGQAALVRANNATGTTWVAPNNIDAAGERFISLALVNGQPAVAYQTGGNTLKYCRSNNANGTAWPAPTVLDSTNSGHGSSLAVVNGNPAISFHRTGPNTLRYIRATDVDGTAWGAAQVLGNCGIGIFNPLAVISGNPAIAYMTTTTNLGYLPGLDASGTVFGPNQSPDPPATIAENLSLEQINAIGPGIGYNVGSNLKFAIYF